MTQFRENLEVCTTSIFNVQKMISLIQPNFQKYCVDLLSYYLKKTNWHDSKNINWQQLHRHYTHRKDWFCLCDMTSKNLITIIGFKTIVSSSFC